MTTPIATFDASIFSPRGPADRELDWFFNLADGDMGDRSTYDAVLQNILPGEPGDHDMDERAEAAHARRAILEWLENLGDYDAGVLKAAYVARPWPLRLREELGRLTGIVVRIAAAESGLPDDDRELDALERRTADALDATWARGAPIVMRFQQKASPILKKAFDAYVRERGGREKPVLEGVS